MHDVAEASKSKRGLEGKLAEVQVSYMVAEQQFKNPATRDSMVEEMLSNDPKMSMMNQEMMQLQYELNAQQGMTKGGHSKERDRLAAQIQAKQLAIAQYKDQIKKQFAGQENDQPNGWLQSLRKEFQIRAGVLQEQIAALDKTIQEKKTRLDAKAQLAVEFEVGQDELEQLQEIEREMSLTLEKMDVEAANVPSIRVIQWAM